MTPERIRELLDAEPFTPFTVHLVDRHSVGISDPSKAWFSDDGRTLIVQTAIRKDFYHESIDTAAITRVIVKSHAPIATSPPPEVRDVSQAQTLASPKTRVLFICTRNSARSQMAEAWLRHLAAEHVEAQSAGFEPGEIHPLAIEAMREVGIDISQQKTKSIFELYRSGAMFAFTICVCDESSEKPPVFPGVTGRLHRSLPDPLAGEWVSDAEILSQMRFARDALRERIETWLSSTVAGSTSPVGSP